MKIIFGVKIFWSGNIMLPKAKWILINNSQLCKNKYYRHGPTNSYKRFCYRWYPFISTLSKTNSTTIE